MPDPEFFSLKTAYKTLTLNCTICTAPACGRQHSPHLVLSLHVVCSLRNVGLQLVGLQDKQRSMPGKLQL